MSLKFLQTEIQDFAFNQLIQNCVAAPDSVFSPYDIIETSPPGVETPDRFSVGALQDRYTNVDLRGLPRAQTHMQWGPMCRPRSTYNAKAEECTTPYIWPDYQNK